MNTASIPAFPDADRQSLDLQGIVRINEEIKRVIRVAFRINIMALNAIFLAKRAGNAALGFSVLSHELRAFSQELRGRMQNLTGLIHGCVDEVSRMLQVMRHTRLMREAARLAPRQEVLNALAGREAENKIHAARLAGLRRQLRQALEDAFQLVELGGVLAKSAKIEAAYGQSYAGALSQVSGEFDGVVEEIRASLETLRKSGFFTVRH